MPSENFVRQNRTFVFKIMKQDCDDENPSPARKSWLERMGRVIVRFLSFFGVPPGWLLRLIFIAIFIGYLVIQAIIKWNTKLLGG
jgi:hypothetical protein